jgi:3-methyladenine DNA glycosylase/8-oxoguanine DNA glycosylase
MMLIFSYYRNNVLPISDFGIRQGLKKLFGIDEITETFTKGLVEKFNIHLTLLAFCLWQISRDK